MPFSPFTLHIKLQPCPRGLSVTLLLPNITTEISFTLLVIMSLKSSFGKNQFSSIEKNVGTFPIAMANKVFLKLKVSVFLFYL